MAKKYFDNQYNYNEQVELITIEQLIPGAIESNDDAVRSGSLNTTESGATLVLNVQSSNGKHNEEVKIDLSALTKDKFLKDVKYDAATKKLIFTFDTSDGKEKIVEVDVADLVDTYEGDGKTIIIDKDNIVSIAQEYQEKVGTISGGVETLNSNLETLSGIVDTVISDLEEFSGNTEADIDSLSGAIDTVASNLDVFSGNTERDIDSISGIVDTVISDLEAEINRAEKVENEKLDIVSLISLDQISSLFETATYSYDESNYPKVNIK